MRRREDYWEEWKEGEKELRGGSVRREYFLGRLVGRGARVKRNEYGMFTGKRGWKASRVKIRECEKRMFAERERERERER